MRIEEEEAGRGYGIVGMLPLLSLNQQRAVILGAEKGDEKGGE